MFKPGDLIVKNVEFEEFVYFPSKLQRFKRIIDQGEIFFVVNDFINRKNARFVSVIDGTGELTCLKSGDLVKKKPRQNFVFDVSRDCAYDYASGNCIRVIAEHKVFIVMNPYSAYHKRFKSLMTSIDFLGAIVCIRRVCFEHV